jgi:transcriptional regulator with XRE-family HTH domain
MSGHRSWSADRKARLADPEIARRATTARAELDRMELEYHRTLSQLRHARRLTQNQLAAALGVSQAQVSRIENQTDLYLSTLRSYVEAMGGELQLRAIFPGGQAAILSVDELAEPPETASAPTIPASHVDIHAVFALVILRASYYEVVEEGFRAATPAA